MLSILYFAVLALLYFFQERLIFFPSKLKPNYKFSFDHPFEEIDLDADGVRINGLKKKVNMNHLPLENYSKHIMWGVLQI